MLLNSKKIKGGAKYLPLLPHPHFPLLCPMVQKLFSIYTHPDESHQLHIEVGSAHLVCWCTAGERAFTALEYFTFTYDDTEGGFIDVFREVKRRSILLSN